MSDHQPNQQNPLLTIALIGGLIFVTMGGCPKSPSPPTDQPTTNKVDRLTYVYEKDEGGVPPAVLAGLSALELSDASVRVSVFENDTVDGDGQVPDQFKVAKATADAHGKPCLVGEATGVVRVVVKSPQTVEDVRRALKP